MLLLLHAPDLSVVVVDLSVVVVVVVVVVDLSVLALSAITLSVLDLSILDRLSEGGTVIKSSWTGDETEAMFNEILCITASFCWSAISFSTTTILVFLTKDFFFFWPVSSSAPLLMTGVTMEEDE